MNNLQKHIQHELGVRPRIEDPVEELHERTLYLVDYLEETDRHGFVLGISGGQDSLLAGFIAQQAVEIAREKGLEATFHAVLLPYSEQKDRQDAEAACDFIQPDVLHDFQIKPVVDAFEAVYNAAMPEELRDYDKGNVKARTRMMAQYAIASHYDLLVIGTDHAAEAVTGFFTKYGDGAADVLPLSGLNKRQGRALLEQIGAPEVFRTKKPTADLLDGNPAQADEAELGITYDQIDDYLEGKEVDEQAKKKIEERFLSTVHKRAQPAAFTDTL